MQRGPTHPLLLVPVPARYRPQPRRRRPPPQQQHRPRHRPPAQRRRHHPPRRHRRIFRGGTGTGNGTGTAPERTTPAWDPPSLPPTPVRGRRNRVSASAAEKDPATNGALRREKHTQPRTFFTDPVLQKKNPKTPNINTLHFVQ